MSVSRKRSLPDERLRKLFATPPSLKLLGTRDSWCERF